MARKIIMACAAVLGLAVPAVAQNQTGPLVTMTGSAVVQGTPDRAWVTVGIARTKVIAKMASRADKPDGLLVVEPDREAAFLRPLPVEALWESAWSPRTSSALTASTRLGSSSAATRGIWRSSSGPTRRGICTPSRIDETHGRSAAGRAAARSGLNRRLRVVGGPDRTSTPSWWSEEGMRLSTFSIVVSAL